MAIAVHQGRHGLVAHYEEDQVIGRSLRLYGEWAEEEVFLLSHVLRPGDTVLDVGANVGSHTLAFSRLVGEGGRVLAVEGQGRAAELLTLTVLLNGLRNVTRIEGLMGGETRVVTLDDAETDLVNLGGRSFRDALERAETTVPASVPAALFTLDSLGLTDCRLIKIDVEQMEFDVLRGGTDTLRRLKPVVYFEQTWATRFAETAALMDELGYELYWHAANPFNGNNVKGDASNIFGGTCEVNVLAVPRGLAVDWPAEVDLVPVRGRDYDPPASRMGVAGWQLPASAYADLPAPARTPAVTLLLPDAFVSRADHDDLRAQFDALMADRVRAQEVMDHQAAQITAMAEMRIPDAFVSRADHDHVRVQFDALMADRIKAQEVMDYQAAQIAGMTEMHEETPGAPAVLRRAERPAGTLLIGHSHTQAIVEAFQARSVQVGWGLLGTVAGESPLVGTEDGDRLRPDIAAALRRRIGPSTVCVSTVAGNAHNVMALVVTGPLFDFRTPGGAEPVNEAVELVPYTSVRLSLGKVLNDGDLAMLRATAVAVPELRLHVESPPPLRDNDMVRARLDRYFFEAHPGAEIADPWLRLKMWRLHGELTRAACGEFGIEVIPVPAEATDADGFLLPAFGHLSSATHANTAYGALVADQIEALTR